MNIFIIGLNHKTTDIKTREMFSLTKECTADAIFKFINFSGVLECAVLSTCNRFEIYIAAEDNFNEDNYVKEIIGYFRIGENLEIEKVFYILKNENAVRHLFSVSCGLDSMIFGEDQILGQVKTAYSIAVNANSTSTILNKLFHYAIKTAKTIKTEINLNHKTNSIGIAAVNMMREKLKKKVNSAEIILIGAGEIAEIALHNLIKLMPKKILILNRTIKNAKKICEKYKDINKQDNQYNTEINTLPLDKIYKELESADAVISAALSPEYLIKYDLCESNFKKRKENAPLLIMDLGIPRNIDPEIGNFKNVTLLNIDDFKTNNSSDNRYFAEIEKIKNIVNNELENFMEWFDKISLIPFIAAFRSMVEKVVTSQTRRLSDKLNNLQITEEKSGEFKKNIKACATAIINQITAAPITKIRNCSNSQSIDKCIKNIECVFGMNNCSNCKNDK